LFQNGILENTVLIIIHTLRCTTSICVIIDGTLGGYCDMQTSCREADTACSPSTGRCITCSPELVDIGYCFSSSITSIWI